MQPCGVQPPALGQRAHAQQGSPKQQVVVDAAGDTDAKAYRDGREARGHQPLRGHGHREGSAPDQQGQHAEHPQRFDHDPRSIGAKFGRVPVGTGALAPSW